jgi:hypothetical protein
MKSFSFEFIKIDLRIINTLQNCKRLLGEHNIPAEKVNVEKLYELKNNFDIVFFDKETFFIAAFVRKKEKEIEFVREFLNEMHEEESIKYIKKEIFQNESLKLDLILEKISNQGMNSLTQREKEFLEVQSKK